MSNKKNGKIDNSFCYFGFLDEFLSLRFEYVSARILPIILSRIKMGSIKYRKMVFKKVSQLEGQHYKLTLGSLELR